MKDLERTVEVEGTRVLLRVETSHEAKDYRKYEDVRNEVWGYPEDHFSAARNMMCENFFHEGSSLFIGAFVADEAGRHPLDGTHLAAFCYGYAGVRDKETGFRDCGNLRFYSQFTAVREEFRSRGLGVLIKEFQREKVLGLFGIRETICTYDPLTGVNAHRNVHHFGMDVLEYRVATYGEYGGLLNRSDVPTDRFLMSWDLTRAPRKGPFDAARISGSTARPVRAETRRVEGKTAPADLEVFLGADPDVRGDAVLVRIPLDFYRMLRETAVADPEVRRIPVDWRLGTRRIFTGLFKRGYRITDFGRVAGRPPWNAYVLEKKD